MWTLLEKKLSQVCEYNLGRVGAASKFRPPFQAMLNRISAVIYTIQNRIKFLFCSHKPLTSRHP